MFGCLLVAQHVGCLVIGVKCGRFASSSKATASLAAFFIALAWVAAATRNWAPRRPVTALWGALRAERRADWERAAKTLTCLASLFQGLGPRNSLNASHLGMGRYSALPRPSVYRTRPIPRFGSVPEGQHLKMQPSVTHTQRSRCQKRAFNWLVRPARPSGSQLGALRAKVGIDLLRALGAKVNEPSATHALSLVCLLSKQPL